MKADLIIKNIDNLITLKGPNRPRAKEEMKDINSIKNGILAIKEDKIIYVGEGEIPDNIEIDENTVFIDGRGKTVTPGLVDPHTHLIHGGSRENELAMKLNGYGYLDILEAGGGIHSTVKATREASFEELYEKAKKSLDIMLSFGVTTVEAKSGYGLDDFETEIRQMEVAKKLDEDHPLDVVSTFMGAHAIPSAYKENSRGFIDLIINEMIPVVTERKLAKFIDVFCEKGVFTVEESKEILEAGKKQGLLAKVHADEIQALGGAELAAEVNCVSAEHLVAASDEGIRKMAEENVIAVLLPATSFNLQSGKFAKARQMIEEGVAVALSTDYNPGSSPTENMQLVMTFASLIMKLTPEEVITAATINAAAALKLEKEIGSIEVGKKADITIFDAPNLNYIIYHFGINHTDSVIKDGKLVYKKSNNII
ncbi:MAG: imidazolonepropionase [Tissierellia bacterium]|nr:imidazolonepropionase [Tissierellia bacterium]